MGGWKTSWSQGYQFPADKYIEYNEKDSNQFVFTTQLSHQFEGITAEDFTLKIILPEGASNIHVNLPFEMETTTRNVYRYLDMRGGRTEIELRAKNIHRQYHNKDITITYRLTALDLWFKPFLVIFYTFAVFLFLIAVLNQNSKIKKD